MIDLVLVMSVNPGFGGQAFIPSALGKIGDIRAMTAGRPIDIEVDGGVGPDVAGQLAAAGANAFVAGSAVFKGGTMESYKANISAIRKPRLRRARRDGLALTRRFQTPQQQRQQSVDPRGELPDPSIPRHAPDDGSGWWRRTARAPWP